MNSAIEIFISSNYFKEDLNKCSLHTIDSQAERSYHVKV